MDFAVAQIGETTRNGNRIVKLQHKRTQDSVLGQINRQETYYAAVKADTVKVKTGDTVSVDLEEYNVVERPFINPETEEEMMLKWLHLK